MDIRAEIKRPLLYHPKPDKIKKKKELKL